MIQDLPDMAAGRGTHALRPGCVKSCRWAVQLFSQLRRGHGGIPIRQKDAEHRIHQRGVIGDETGLPWRSG